MTTSGVGKMEEDNNPKPSTRKLIARVSNEEEFIDIGEGKSLSPKTGYERGKMEMIISGGGTSYFPTAFFSEQSPIGHILMVDDVIPMECDISEMDMQSSPPLGVSMQYLFFERIERLSRDPHVLAFSELDEVDQAYFGLAHKPKGKNKNQPTWQERRNQSLVAKNELVQALKSRSRSSRSSGRKNSARRKSR
jgi:hypothetical protein